MEIPSDPDVRRAFSLAMLRLARRDQFTAEIERELIRQGFPSLIVVQAIEALNSQGLLNDRRTIQNFLHKHEGKRAAGAEKIRAALLARGANEEEVEAALGEGSPEDERAQMRALLAGRTWKQGDRAKAGRFLIQRGFDPELVEGVLEHEFGDRAD